MTIVLNGTTGITTPTTSTTGEFVTSVTGFKNRIINGGMVIDQRNAGASVTPSADTYLLDRWGYSASQTSKFTFQQNKGSVTLPDGFANYLGASVASAVTVGASDYFALYTKVEGFNAADLGWGAAGASAVTLSFKVYSSLTGTFGGTVCNSANTRCYPFTYSIPVANTWTTISITIAGDTTGTWLKTNGTGINIQFGLGVGSTYSGTAGSWSGTQYISATGATSVVGTLNATFYITGVQLEKGSTATNFDYRPYGTELQLCQRYYYQLKPAGTNPIAVGYCRATTRMDTYVFFPVTMRSAPTGSVVSGTNFYYVDYSQASTNMNSFTIDQTYFQGARLVNTGLSGLTAGSGAALYTNDATASASFNAEL